MSEEVLIALGVGILCLVLCAIIKYVREKLEGDGLGIIGTIVALIGFVCICYFAISFFGNCIGCGDLGSNCLN